MEIQQKFNGKIPSKLNNRSRVSAKWNFELMDWHWKQESVTWWVPAFTCWLVRWPINWLVLPSSFHSSSPLLPPSWRPYATRNLAAECPRQDRPTSTPTSPSASSGLSLSVGTFFWSTCSVRYTYSLETSQLSVVDSRSLDLCQLI